MSDEKKVLSQKELESIAAGRNEVKRRRAIYNQQLEERRLKTQGAQVEP